MAKITTNATFGDKSMTFAEVDAALAMTPAREAEDAVSSEYELHLPSTVEIDVEYEDGDDPAVDLRILLRLINSRYSITEVRIADQSGGESEVDGNLLRRLPITRWVQDGVLSALITNQQPTSSGASLGVTTIGPEHVAAGPTPDGLRAVAFLYQVAIAARIPPLKLIVSQLKFGHPKAADWVKRARAQGILGQTTQGKVGGTSTEMISIAEAIAPDAPAEEVRLLEETGMTTIEAAEEWKKRQGK